MFDRKESDLMPKGLNRINLLSYNRLYNYSVNRETPELKIKMPVGIKAGETGEKLIALF